MPPRYLKSISISVAFPAWVMAQNPENRVIVASYSQALATQHSTDTRKIMQSNWYKKAFPKTIIAKGANQKNFFQTSQNGFRFATSLNGSLTGVGGDLLIVDDPHKPTEINSAKKREQVYNWFQGTLCSRLNNKKDGQIVVVMQRLHEHDLIGRILENDINNEWTFLNLQAIATKNEQHRTIGDSLHPERESTQELLSLKREIGSYSFNAQYQQNPLNTTDGIIKHNWIKQVNQERLNNLESPIKIISLDSAIKTGESNDFTAITFWKVIRQSVNTAINITNKTLNPTTNKTTNQDINEAINSQSVNQSQGTTNASKDTLGDTSGGTLEDTFENPEKYNFYLEDVLHDKYEFFQLVIKVREIVQSYNPDIILIEDKASGSMLLQEIRRIFPEIKCIGVIPTSSKINRLISCSVLFESKRVHFLDEMAKLNETIAELTLFPNVKHDDIVDSISMLLNWCVSNLETLYHKKPAKKKSEPVVRIL